MTNAQAPMTYEISRRTLIRRLPSLNIGHWVLVILWSLVIGNWSFSEPCGPKPSVIKHRIGGPSDSSVRSSFESVDHSDFDALLHEFVDTEGLVYYQAWKNDSQAIVLLHNYVCSLGQIDTRDPTASEESELAFYINAYNALALWGILEAYPTASIQRPRQHNERFRIPLLSGKQPSYSIFEDLELWIDGDYLSLSSIEHDILRSLEEPRIHFAIVCAAKGCPKLRNEAYVADRLEEQLIDNALDFFSNKNRLKVHRHRRKIELSPILDWFGEDFGDSDAEVLQTIFPYLPLAARQWVAEHPCPKIGYLGYDWSINDRCPSVSVRIGTMRYAFYAKLEPYLRWLLPNDSESIPKPDSSVTQETFSEPARRIIRKTPSPPRAVPPEPQPPRPVPIVPEPVDDE